jgi:hypothetical protein
MSEYGRTGDIKHLNKAIKRAHGVEKAVDRLTKEEIELDELSKKTLGSYVQRAADDMAGNAYAVGAKDPQKPTAGFGKSFKRQKGIAKAVGRLTKEETNSNEASE